jgi:glucosyl-3-phosphoglycerate phosphatase
MRRLGGIHDRSRIQHPAFRRLTELPTSRRARRRTGKRPEQDTIVNSDQTRQRADRTLVYLARHGQTPLNESDVLRGLADPPLDDTGCDQARRLGAMLGRRNPCAVIASPLRRAVQTAQPVAEQAGLEAATDQRLVDRDYGQCTGASRESVIERFGSVDAAPGVEPRSAVRDRAIAGLTDIVRHNRGGTVVVVSHDAVNREVLVAFDPSLGDPDTVPQENGCFNTLEMTGGQWVVLRVNELPADGLRLLRGEARRPVSCQSRSHRYRG